MKDEFVEIDTKPLESAGKSSTLVGSSKSASKDRQRKSYTLQKKLECLDYYKKHGKDLFWSEFEDKVRVESQVYII